MKKNRLGRTDIEVSRICLGTMTWGRQNTEAEGHRQMDRAVDAGINFFDTAELYAVPPNAESQGRTEEYIGSWFRRSGRRQDIVLASKMIGRGMPWIRGGNTPINRQSLTDALDGNLSRLGTDYIDLYQLHWPNRAHYHFGAVWNFDASVNRPAEIRDNLLEILETLSEFVRAGKIREIGLSNESAWGLMQYLSLAERHDLPRVATIQNEYNLTCRIFEPDLAETCLMEDVSLLAYSPLSAGAISGKYLDGAVPEGSRRAVDARKPHRAGPETDAAIREYIAVAERHGLDVCQMAIAFALSRPFMGSVIIGATSDEQLAINIGAEALTLDAAVLADIAAVRRSYPIPY